MCYLQSYKILLFMNRPYIVPALHVVFNYGKNIIEWLLFFLSFPYYVVAPPKDASVGINCLNLTRATSFCICLGYQVVLGAYHLRKDQFLATSCDQPYQLLGPSYNQYTAILLRLLLKMDFTFWAFPQ